MKVVGRRRYICCKKKWSNTFVIKAGGGGGMGSQGNNLEDNDRGKDATIQNTGTNNREEEGVFCTL